MLMGQCSHMLKPGKERARSVPVNHRDEDERGFGTSLEVRLIKATVFPVVMYGCESWTVSTEELMLLNCGVGEDCGVESPLDCKEIKPVHPKGNQS